MPETNNFFVTPDLGEDSGVGKTKGEANPANEVPTERECMPQNFFTNTDFVGNQQNVGKAEVDRPALNIITESEIQNELSDTIRREMTALLSADNSDPIIRSTVIDNPKERVIIRFSAPSRKISSDIDIPLDITANDLVVGLNEAYKLGIDTSDFHQCYLSCDNPIALIRGKHLLGEYGIRDGSQITYLR